MFLLRMILLEGNALSSRSISPQVHCEFASSFSYLVLSSHQPLQPLNEILSNVVDWGFWGSIEEE